MKQSFNSVKNDVATTNEYTRTHQGRGRPPKAKVVPPPNSKISRRPVLIPNFDQNAQKMAFFCLKLPSFLVVLKSRPPPPHTHVGRGSGSPAHLSHVNQTNAAAVPDGNKLCEPSIPIDVVLGTMSAFPPEIIVHEGGVHSGTPRARHPAKATHLGYAKEGVDFVFGVARQRLRALKQNDSLLPPPPP